jgi:hypothetical protein
MTSYRTYAKLWRSHAFDCDDAMCPTCFQMKHGPWKAMKVIKKKVMKKKVAMKMVKKKVAMKVVKKKVAMKK